MEQETGKCQGLLAKGGPYCNFCGGNELMAGYLVPGAVGVHICWQCADSALEVIKLHNIQKKS